MHWEILDRSRQELLKKITTITEIEDCYLAGGTALSLQMGLRKSVDFDFFVPHPFNTDDVLLRLRKLYPDLHVIQHQTHTLDVVIKSVQVSYFQYPYNMVKGFVRDADLPELQMASPEDIAAMKVSAIGSRGAKKDFFDLYQICKKENLSPKKTYGILQAKFGKKTDFSYMIMGLSYFEDADRETLADVFVPWDWKEEKVFFCRFAKEMQDIVMGMEEI